MIIEFWKTGENPITCYSSRKMEEPDNPKAKKTKGVTSKIKVTVVDVKGKVQEYESVRKAAEAVQVHPANLCAFLNGRAPLKTNYTIYKSLINN